MFSVLVFSLIRNSISQNPKNCNRFGKIIGGLGEFDSFWDGGYAIWELEPRTGRSLHARTLPHPQAAETNARRENAHASVDQTGSADRPGCNDSATLQIAVYRGAGRAPKGNFLKEVSLWTPFKNFKKNYYLSMLFESFWRSKNLFSKRFLAAGGRSPAPL